MIRRFLLVGGLHHLLGCRLERFPRKCEELGPSNNFSGLAERSILPGEWVEYTWAIRTVVDFVMFQSRFVEAFGLGEVIDISFKVGPLTGRKLVALRWEIAMGYGAPEPCRAPFFTFDRRIDAESLRSGWEPTCAEVLKHFVERFPIHRISQETLLKWVKKYKTRQF